MDGRGCREQNMNHASFMRGTKEVDRKGTNQSNLDRTARGGGRFGDERLKKASHMNQGVKKGRNSHKWKIRDA